MNSITHQTSAAEINRLHEEARQCCRVSHEALHGALVAAWHAGQLLVSEKKRVNHTMGLGAWLHWLKANFKGTVRTAQRYVRLAQSVPDVDLLTGMSLRQAYARLGIATEPKTPGKRRLRHRIPTHLVLANKLMRTLKRPTESASNEQREAYQRDLRALYEKLRLWFDSPRTDYNTQNFGAVSRSYKP
ncbi:MAG: hypothetical protein WC205_15740 [Opitutaceae bacterium]|jgi:hypothetical protein